MARAGFDNNMQRWEIKLNVDIGCKMYSFHISVFTNISELQIIPSLLLQSKIPLMCQSFDYLKKIATKIAALSLSGRGHQSPFVNTCTMFIKYYKNCFSSFLYNNNRICRLSVGNVHRN